MHARERRRVKAPRAIYLHGFASGRGSAKGRALASVVSDLGGVLELPDLNLPSFERLSLLVQLEHVRALLDRDPRPAILIGSSMGGYLATLLAARREGEPASVPTAPNVVALVLLAPAFDLAARWRQRLGEAGWERWKRDGSMLYPHFAVAPAAPLHSAFFEEAETLPPMPGTSLPVTVIQGRRDETVPHATARAWVDANRQARLVELDDDHLLAASTASIAHELQVHWQALKER